MRSRDSRSTVIPVSIDRRIVSAFLRWFDTSASTSTAQPGEERIDWLRVIPFIGMHAMCLGVFFVGFSWTAFWIAFALYALRMFSITAFYHRYFSHKAFKTS